MWQYEKKLQFPINIKRPNPTLANYIISQYGGADGKCLSKNHFQNTHFIVFPSFPPLTISLKIVLAILFFSTLLTFSSFKTSVSLRISFLSIFAISFCGSSAFFCFIIAFKLAISSRRLFLFFLYSSSVSIPSS
ncbi:MAG: hypothetical protein E7602_08700 [Ruminococcaceae bacterium]|nr:hypothetical protein [Oscillospiraceae bacterium]